MTLPDERELIEALTRALSSGANRAGFDSDCAVVELGALDLVATVDGFARATHFPEGLEPAMAGRLAARATLADLAAAGAQPVGVLAAYGIPPDEDRDALVELAEAVGGVLADAGGEVLGGDTKPRSELTLTLTALGTCPAGSAMTRSAAKPGDLVVLTGPLGGAGAALDRIRAGLDPSRADPLVPPLRVEAGLALREAGVRCAMDLSDGLADAASAIAGASGVEVRVDREAIPLHPSVEDGQRGIKHALGTGGDYELAATFPPELEETVLEELDALSLAPCVVGRVTEGEGAVLETEGAEIGLDRGFEHPFGDDGSMGQA